MAGALLTPAALATITAIFSGEERGAAIGTWTAWTGISFVIGPLVGGWLVVRRVVALDLLRQRPARDRDARTRLDRPARPRPSASEPASTSSAASSACSASAARCSR
jgi:hypothetical protein